MTTIETNVSGFTSRGMSHYDLRNYREALDDFNEAIRQNPKEAAAFRYRGLVREELNQAKEAVADYSMAISINPEYDKAYVDRGRARHKLEQYKLAICNFNEAIRINPHNAEAFEDRGKTKTKSDDILSGNEDIDKARQLRNRWRNGRSLISIVVLLLFCIITTAPAQTTLPAEDIAEKALAATVYLEMKDRNGKTLGFGSGFFVKPNLIATNYHVIEGAAQGMAKLVGKYTTYNIEGFTATDQANDLAILKVTAYGIKPLSLGDSGTIHIGETVYVAGNPKGLEGIFLDGIISNRQNKDTGERFQMTTPISLGSGGGPVLNRKGEVIGVSVPWYRDSDDSLDVQTPNIVIPSNYVKTLLTDFSIAKPLGQDNIFISPDTYFRWGYMKLELGNYKGAIADLTEAIRLAPKNIYAYFNRGVAKSYLGQYTDAIADWNEAIGLNPDFFSAYVNRGFLRGKLGQYIAAIADYDTAILLESDFAEAYNGRGGLRHALGQYAAAITDYDTVIRLKPRDALAFYNRGSAKFQLKQYASAVLDFDDVIRLKPDFAEAFYIRGSAKFQLGQDTSAVLDFDNAIRLKPDFAEAFYERGRVRSTLGKYASAITDFDTAIKIKNNDALSYFFRGLAKYMLGRTRDANQDLQTALGLAEKTGDVRLKADIEGALQKFRQ